MKDTTTAAAGNAPAAAAEGRKMAAKEATAVEQPLLQPSPQPYPAANDVLTLTPRTTLAPAPTPATVVSPVPLVPPVAPVLRTLGSWVGCGGALYRPHAHSCGSTASGNGLTRKH